MFQSIDGTFAFYHVPKTGGLSIGAALIPFLKLNPRGLVKPSEPSRVYHWHGLHTAATVASGTRKRCAFVRNPWHRALSRWRWYRNPGESFLSFWRRMPSGPVLGPEPHERSMNIVKPMLYYCNPRFDFIGRFENLASDFVRMCEFVGIDPPSLPHENRQLSSGPVLGPDWRSLYDVESREVIADRYAADIDAFNYTFEE